MGVSVRLEIFLGEYSGGEGETVDETSALNALKITTVQFEPLVAILSRGSFHHSLMHHAHPHPKLITAYDIGAKNVGLTLIVLALKNAASTYVNNPNTIVHGA